jgi:hypothetical protein
LCTSAQQKRNHLAAVKPAVGRDGPAEAEWGTGGVCGGELMRSRARHEKSCSALKLLLRRPLQGRGRRVSHAAPVWRRCRRRGDRRISICRSGRGRGSSAAAHELILHFNLHILRFVQGDLPPARSRKKRCGRAGRLNGAGRGDMRIT